MSSINWTSHTDMWDITSLPRKHITLTCILTCGTSHHVLTMCLRAQALRRAGNFKLSVSQQRRRATRYYNRTNRWFFHQTHGSPFPFHQEPPNVISPRAGNHLPNQTEIPVKLDQKAKAAAGPINRPKKPSLTSYDIIGETHMYRVSSDERSHLFIPTGPIGPRTKPIASHVLLPSILQIRANASQYTLELS